MDMGWTELEVFILGWADALVQGFQEMTQPTQGNST